MFELTGIKARVIRLNVIARTRRALGLFAEHPSGYTAGYSSKDKLPIIDGNGNRTGRVIERADAEDSCRPHPTVHLLLFRDNGGLLVQRRALSKASSGGKLSQSVGGHVTEKQTNEQALIAEVEQELNIKNWQDFQRVVCFPYVSRLGRNRELVTLYSGVYNGQVVANPSELDWAEFFDPQLVLALTREKPQWFAPSFLADLHYLDEAVRASGVLR